MKNFVLFLVIIFANSLFAQQNMSNSSKIALNSDVDLLLSNQNTSHALILVNSLANDSVCAANHIIVNSKLGNIWSIQFNSNNANSLSKLSFISYIELATKTTATRLKNDIERTFTKVDKVQNGLTNGLPLNYTGKGVVVGIVDIGFQGNNPTFFDNQGKNTRVVKLWEQSNKNGTPPNGYSYGTEYKDSTSIINSNDKDGSHGTHVVGIAAGSGFSTPNFQYRGMAPQADIVLVSIKYANDTLGGSALGDYIVANPTIIDAYKYIFDYAQSVGKPAVINLSWGMHTGPHDGTSLFDKATEQLIGKGKVLVGANGNDGDNPMHWNYAFNSDTAKTLAIENNRQNRISENIYTDFWGSKNTSFKLKVSIIDTNMNLIAETPFVSSLSNTSNNFNILADSNNFKISLTCANSNALNQKPNITIMANQPNTKKYIISLSITSSNSIVHGWNSGAAKTWTSGSFRNKVGKFDFSNTYTAGNTDYTNSENGGTSTAVISVGALAARSAYINVKGKLQNDSSYVLPGNITKFSSKGPTADGRIKPDISAPGFDVPSAINNTQFESWMLDRTVLKTAFRGDTNYWTTFNGTSMASPHVCGIVALILQANPNLTALQIRTILNTTATINSNTGSVPNNQYGYGIINAYEAIKSALQYAGINAFNKNQNVVIFPNPANSFLNIQTDGLYIFTIYSTDGKEISTNSLENLNNSINIDGLLKGIYIIKILKDNQLYVFKFIKY
ncbi:MAG: S8 family serine peptidase [Bacteroidetes bacterium]|nr:S8 family serine peptidase [Bacteroidota bacterium]